VTKNVHIHKSMFNVYKNQLSRQTGSRNLTGSGGIKTEDDRDLYMGY
jgi:hypothetical protein